MKDFRQQYERACTALADAHRELSRLYALESDDRIASAITSEEQRLGRRLDRIELDAVYSRVFGALRLETAEMRDNAYPVEKAAQDGLLPRDRALALQCKRVRSALKGERNKTLNMGAYAVALECNGDAAFEQRAKAELRLAAEQAGLTSCEIEATLRSAFARGMNASSSAEAVRVAGL